MRKNVTTIKSADESLTNFDDVFPDQLVDGPGNIAALAAASPQLSKIPVAPRVHRPTLTQTQRLRVSAAASGHHHHFVVQRHHLVKVLEKIISNMLCFKN